MRPRITRVLWAATAGRCAYFTRLLSRGRCRWRDAGAAEGVELDRAFQEGNDA